MSTLDGTYGALFLGLLVSAVLFGVTMLQTFVYFQQYPSDRVWRKLAVSWLWLLDGLHLALSAHFVYYYLVVNYDNPSALLKMTLSFKFRTIVDGLVVVSVHTLYTFRLWTLLAIDESVEPFGKEDRRWSSQKITIPQYASRWMMRKIVPWFVSALNIVGYGIAIAMCFETFRLDTFDRLTHAPFATYIPLISSTVMDVVIASSLCYFLARCRTEIGAMNGPLRKLMVYTLNTGIITSVGSVMAISMMIAYPTTFATVAIELLVIKLYINSYLAMLNARGGIHDHSGRTRPGYTPNPSFVLREEAPLDQKLVSFPPFPQSASSTNLGWFSDNARGSLRAPHDAVVDFSNAMPEPPFTARAPRMSHPDVCPGYDAIESAVTHVYIPTIASRLAAAPPVQLDAASPGMPSRNETPVSRGSNPPPSDPSFPAPRQDYPSPPEPALSPLRFGSSTFMGGAALVSFYPETEAPAPIVYAPRDKFTRMVRSARSRGKARRALFDEHGVAVMWGL